ncbi:MAG: undecaprenyl/decaprenyl-phosphate alpha-N-acetylglucosaminyl 1-phosphate transferase [Prevotellaceae bacterium]|jgi:UDP-N-acetylmuramyl pentapeptide phosphotransferase/UDP-N-acetylglucosamine-1-phosphate transferase|nr:undecaprenyl/decaprenyl-phosphate alpha-N-acetylglucosaminyl 1-phosphate transferase [Prevotellaceae bacterium]
MHQLLTTHYWLLPFIAFFIAFVSVSLIHPLMLKLALAKDIVDKPNSRKLQRRPIPILGGVAMSFGIFMGLGCVSPYHNSILLVVVTVLICMLYIGTIDDIMTMSFRLRLLIEIGCVLLLIYVGGYAINSFHGVWSVGSLPDSLSIALTLFASVGIINAINFIDGVDGLSSGFCIMASVIFSVFFFLFGDRSMAILAMSCCGALIPFFLHNVFGKTSKMFIGDGGTLVMGMIMSVFVIHILDEQTAHYETAETGNLGLIPFLIAVLSIPVFDTVRVIIRRMYHGKSPFQPDKTHLHHLFIEFGFSHSVTTVCILLLNVMVVVTWWILYTSGASIDMQLYGVVMMAFLCTFGVYFFGKSLSHNSKMYRTMRRLGVSSHIERKGVFLWIQKKLDKV